MLRLDVSGSLIYPKHIRLVTRSSALSCLEYLNISRCAFDETSFTEIFGKETNLENIEVLGMAELMNFNRSCMKFPSKEKLGNRLKLKVIDLRGNKNMRWRFFASKAALSTVMIFAWG